MKWRPTSGTIADYVDMDTLTDNSEQSELTPVEQYMIKYPDKDAWIIACVLSGCDYVASCKNIACVSAFKQLMAAGGPNQYKKVMAKWAANKKKAVPPQYPTKVEQAILTFQYHRVFDTDQDCVVNLTPIPKTDKRAIENQPISDFLGEDIDPEIARKVRTGELPARKDREGNRVPRALNDLPECNHKTWTSTTGPNN